MCVTLLFVAPQWISHSCRIKDFFVSFYFVFHFSVSLLNSVWFFFSFFSLHFYLHFLSLQVGLERKCVWPVTVREATWVWRHRCALLPLACECQMASWQPTQLPCWPPTHRPPVCWHLWIPCCRSVCSPGVSAPTQVGVCLYVFKRNEAMVLFLSDEVGD